ncbi:MAG: hypothetical protein A4E52_00002 [Pelotomaculum sp. PtaB.Bin013]|uniref:Stalk domain-containing protein n=1 Tax=Pelotomaculum isophthalicicum JI TaxID=947010 RepID=A0A9X4JWR0_9FIRM|nr:stalk domain-containing protein [Pelotomaculum isophthalicicum]MDF9409972.1 stalk domain-containing protein [Pelotomaculum isophthalicicum JI]OPX92237.1 MAG: hypothetical protein A4E52_00002 [Pelotomaculum sp. PtaB.Bin013]
MNKYLLLLFLLLCLMNPVNATAGQIYLNENNNGEVLYIQEEQTVDLILDSNPSTGYSWNYSTKPDSYIMEETGHEFRNTQALAEKPPIIGAEEKECWSYKASKTGKTTICLWYIRPWESRMPLKTFTAEINVLPQIKVLLNQNPLEFDVPPIIEDDHTLVPLRAIFEAIGAEVNWFPDTQTVIATKDNKIIKFIVGNNTASINGTDVQLEVPSIIIKNSVMVPLRFILEALGYKVEWDGNNTINIYS